MVENEVHCIYSCTALKYKMLGQITQWNHYFLSMFSVRRWLNIHNESHHQKCPFIFAA